MHFCLKRHLKAGGHPFSLVSIYRKRYPEKQKPLKPGDKPTPLLVMSHGRLLTAEEFKPYKTEIYELVYGVSIF
jgi:hypothetical protein